MTKPVAAERRPRPFHDLREYMAAVKEMGHLKIVEGADGELEIGALTGNHRRAQGLSGIALRLDQRLFPRYAVDDQYAE